jgi:hypothetical protein
MAADMRKVTNVGLKLVPVALVRKADDGVKSVLAHELAHSAPTAGALLVAELWQAEASFTAVYHRFVVHFLRIFLSLYEVHRSLSSRGLVKVVLSR